MNAKLLFLLVLALIFYSQCEKRSDGVNSLIVLNQSAPEDVCPTGGITIYTGLDLNSDGILSADEVQDSSFICSGSNTLLRTEIEPKGQNCDAGGFKIFTGTDVNGDGYLNDSEIQDTSYVCHGKSIKQLIIGDSSDPDIEYSDMEPDLEIWGERYVDVIYNLDLNDDGMDDLQFISWLQESPSHRLAYSKIKSMDSAVYISIVDTANFPQIHKQGDVINNINNWISGELLLASFYASIGDTSETIHLDGIWHGINQQFLAIRINYNSDINYGWLMISVRDNYPNQLTLHEYAVK